jgi:hypothetical protein
LTQQGVRVRGCHFSGKLSAVGSIGMAVQSFGHCLVFCPDSSYRNHESGLAALLHRNVWIDENSPDLARLPMSMTKYLALRPLQAIGQCTGKLALSLLSRREWFESQLPRAPLIRSMRIQSRWPFLSFRLIDLVYKTRYKGSRFHIS